MGSFSLRLRAIIGSRTVRAFAQEYGEELHRVQNILAGKQRPPADFLAKLHLHESIDLNWLLCGTVSRKVSPNQRESVLLANYRRVSEAQKADLEQKAAAAYQRFMRQEGGQRE